MLSTGCNKSKEVRVKAPALRKMLRAIGSAGLLVIAFTSNVMADAFEIKESIVATGGETGDTTIVIRRLSDGQHWIANSNRAQLRFSPASTSKIPQRISLGSVIREDCIAAVRNGTFAASISDLHLMELILPMVTSRACLLLASRR